MHYPIRTRADEQLARQLSTPMGSEVIPLQNHQRMTTDKTRWTIPCNTRGSDNAHWMDAGSVSAKVLARCDNSGPCTKRQQLLRIQHLPCLDHALDCSNLDSGVCNSTGRQLGLHVQRRFQCDNRLRGREFDQPVDQTPSSRVGRRDDTKHSRVRHCEPCEPRR
jgi:hypothetical protein